MTTAGAPSSVSFLILYDVTKVILFFHTVHTDRGKSRDGLKFKT